jgi:hypothetical protein
MTLKKDICEQYYQSLEGQSWCTFTISPIGDFFIHSDWGYWAFNWRSFGTDFKGFLIGINKHYLFDKLESNELQHNKKKMSSRAKVAIDEHFTQFQKSLKEETQPVPV